MHTAARPAKFLVSLVFVGIAASQSIGRADENTAPTASIAPIAGRDELYSQLAADVADLEQRGSILKRVVKLVTPTVVHIEARRENDTARSPRGDSEET